jgi:hypothetical protein
MDPTKTQQSFIPKKSSGSRETHISGGLFYFLGVIIFTVAIAASVGVFVYEKFLEGRIASMQGDLERAREMLQPDLIEDLVRANLRFESAEEILKNHRTVSTFFDLLEQLTLQNVRFSSLTYTDEQVGLTVTMDGEARSYSTLAYQAEVFGDESLFRNVEFSDLDLNEQGNVVFVTKILLDSKAVSYEEMIQSLSESPAPDEIPTEQPVASSTNATSTNPIKSQ